MKTIETCTWGRCTSRRLCMRVILTYIVPHALRCIKWYSAGLHRSFLFKALKERHLLCIEDAAGRVSEELGRNNTRGVWEPVQDTNLLQTRLRQGSSSFYSPLQAGIFLLPQKHRSTLMSDKLSSPAVRLCLVFANDQRNVNIDRNGFTGHVSTDSRV